MEPVQVAETAPPPRSLDELRAMLDQVEQYNEQLEQAKVPPELQDGLIAIQHLLDDAMTRLADVTDKAVDFGMQVREVTEGAMHGHGADFIVIGLTVFVLAIFVGYHVVWRVTPALHSPLMAVTNAISSVIIVGALIAAGPADINFSTFMGFLAVVLASVNIFGGFIVTQRMLSMFRKKK